MFSYSKFSFLNLNEVPVGGFVIGTGEARSITMNQAVAAATALLRDKWLDIGHPSDPE